MHSDVQEGGNTCDRSGYGFIPGGLRTHISCSECLSMFTGVPSEFSWCIWHEQNKNKEHEKKRTKNNNNFFKKLIHYSTKRLPTLES